MTPPGSEVATGAVADAANEAKGILRLFFGPIAAELGETIALPAREMRMTRTAAMLQRAEVRVKALSSETPTLVRIPARGALPLLEAASVEDDAFLCEWYADLLANAALGQGTDDLGSFAEITKQLSPRDAHLFQLLVHRHTEQLRNLDDDPTGRTRAGAVRRPLVGLAQMLDSGLAVSSSLDGLLDVSCSWTQNELLVSADNLFRLGLLRDMSRAEVVAPPPSDRAKREVRRVQRIEIRGGRPTTNTPTNVLFQPTRQWVALSHLGLAFARSINPPDAGIPDVALIDPPLRRQIRG